MANLDSAMAAPMPPKTEMKQIKMKRITALKFAAQGQYEYRDKPDERSRNQQPPKAANDSTVNPSQNN
jgi:hypothetical protein